MKKILTVVLICSLVLINCTFTVKANDSLRPGILLPFTLENVHMNKATKLQWSAPTTGNVTKYIISVREIRVGKDPTDILIVDQAETTACYYNIAKGKVKAKGLYRASVCAVFADGTKKYSYERYFYGAYHNGISENTSATFKVFSGFETRTKEAISHSAQTINNAYFYRTNALIEISSQETDYPIVEFDGTNMIVPIMSAETTTNKAVMTVHYRRKDITKELKEADITVDKFFSWGNGAAGKYDIQNCMTHEMGHVAGIADLYDTDLDHSEIPEMTMYGKTVVGETKKRTLHQLDNHLILQLYGELF